MSRSKCRSSLCEVRYAAQLIYLVICVGLPDVPHEGFRPCDGIYHHCRCPFDAWVIPQSSNPCDRLYRCEKRSNVRKQLPQTTMPVFCDDGVFHTVTHIVSQTPWWWTSMAGLEGFTVRRFYHDALVAASVVPGR